MATYPAAIPDLDTDFYANPLGAQKYLDLLAELQAVFDKLGINPQGLFGTVSARLAEIDAKTTSLANFGLTGLRIANNAATPTTKLDITCTQIGIEGAIASNVAVTIDLTATGKNGTAFPRAIVTWYYIWLGINPGTGEVCGLLDNDATRAGLDTSHASLAGFSKWRRIGARRTNGTSGGQFPVATQHDDQLLYFTAAEAIVFLVSATAGTPNTHDVASAVPPTSRLACVFFQVLGDSTNQNLTKFSVRQGGSTTDQPILSKYANTDSASGGPAIEHWMTLTPTQTYEWVATSTVNGNSSTRGVWINVMGYRDAL